MCINMIDATGILIEFVLPVNPACTCDDGIRYRLHNGYVVSEPCPWCAAGRYAAANEALADWFAVIGDDIPAPSGLLAEAAEARFWRGIEARTRPAAWERAAEIDAELYADYADARYEQQTAF